MCRNYFKNVCGNYAHNDSRNYARIVLGMLHSINIQCLGIIIPNIIENMIDYYAHNDSSSNACGQINNYGHEWF